MSCQSSGNPVSPFPQNLRVAQAISTVSNIELARAVGVAPRTVGKWRRGEVEITLSNLTAVARVLGREPAWFLQEHTHREVAA